MKLRNKKTGEIVEVCKICPEPYEARDFDCNSLAELNEEWEDYEEPKGSALDLMILTLTNFIENEPDEDKVDLEDCKQMLDRLMAWKRLKDKGFEITGWKFTPDMKQIKGNFVTIKAIIPYIVEKQADLDLLFGGEE